MKMKKWVLGAIGLMCAGLFTTAASAETLTVMIGSEDSGGVAVKAAMDKAAEIMGIDLEYSVFPTDQFLNVLNTKGATGNLDDVIFTSYSLSDLPYNDVRVKTLGRKAPISQKP